MITYTPFRAAHLESLTPQAAQKAEYDAAMIAQDAYLLEGPMSLTAWQGVRCLGVAGLLPATPYRATAWLLLSDKAGAAMLPITRKVSRVTALSPYKRIDLTVKEGFAAGHQFARLIGAKIETPEPMKWFGPNGESEIIYAWIRG